METNDLISSRWLNAAWEPNYQIHTFPRGMEMVDLVGKAKSVLIVMNLLEGNLVRTNVKVFNSFGETTDYIFEETSCSIMAFYTENNDKKSIAIAMASGPGIMIFKNMMPHFKFCLPCLTGHPDEQQIWLEAGLGADLDRTTLLANLTSLQKNIGSVHFSSRSLKFLKTNSDKNMSIQYLRWPIIKLDTITVTGSIRKDSWSNIASSYIIIGTESGELFIIDHRSFVIIDKYVAGWSPAAVASEGLWISDGFFIIGGRNGQLSVLRQKKYVKKWAQVSSPTIAIAVLNFGIAVITMNHMFTTFSKKGNRLWNLKLLECPLDIISLSLPRSGSTFVAISIANYGIQIYNKKIVVDTIVSTDSISCLKYGQLGQEEHTMAMVMYNGALSIKILKRTADFQASIVPSNFYQPYVSKFLIPKRTKFFIDQTIRERLQAKNIYITFQQGILRMCLITAENCLISNNEKNKFAQFNFTIQAYIFGLRPNMIVEIIFMNISSTKIMDNLFIICKYHNINTKPTIVNLPCGYKKIVFPVTLSIFFNELSQFKINILLCSKKILRPLAKTIIVIPLAEEARNM